MRLNKLATPTVSGLLLISALTTALGFSVPTQKEDLPRLSVIGSSDLGPREVPLKGTRQNGDITKVSDFKVDFNDVIQIPQGQNLVLTPDSSARGFSITKVRIVDEQRRAITLIPASDQRNSFSLIGIPNGVYILNVVGRLGDIEGGYENILVKLPSSQPTTEFNEEIKKLVEKKINEILFIDIHAETIFEEPGSTLPWECLYYPDSDQCKPPEGETCPEGYSMNEKSHCYPTAKCPDGFWRADDDESGACVPNAKPGQ